METAAVLLLILLGWLTALAWPRDQDDPDQGYGPVIALLGAMALLAGALVYAKAR
jgi:hypothetical protein